MAQVPGRTGRWTPCGVGAPNGPAIGTNIEVNLEELPRRDVYQLWVIDTSGKWSNAGTWSATPSATVILTAATAVATVEIDRVVVTSADRDEILLDASV